MDNKQQAPGNRSENQGQTGYNQHKSSNDLPKHQHKVYNLLKTGGRYSVADISRILGYSDPRGHIRHLRAKGIPVLDEWISAKDGVRFKVYFLKPEPLTK